MAAKTRDFLVYTKERREMIQTVLPFVEEASPHIEAILAETCGRHRGTTLDWSSACPVCDLEASAFAEPEPVNYPNFQPEWTRRAAENRLPYKVYSR